MVAPTMMVFAAIKIENGGELRKEAENVWFRFEFWIMTTSGSKSECCVRVVATRRKPRSSGIVNEYVHGWTASLLGNQFFQHSVSRVSSYLRGPVLRFTGIILC